MIDQISLQNFRGHTRKLTFRPGYNTVVGKNEVGKSSIKEGIAFLWFGTDSAGTKNPDHLISVGKEAAVVAIKTPKAVITRRKKRGSTSEIKLEREGFPPLKLNQTDLSGQLQLSLETFMSCWQVGYFMSLKAVDRLKVLAEVARIDRKDLLQSILPAGTVLPTQLKYVNTKIDADVVAGLRRADQNKKTSDEGALKQVEAQYQSLSGGDAVDVDSYQAFVNELQAKVESFDNYQRLLTAYEKEKGKYDSWAGSVDRIQNAISAENKKLEDLQVSQDKTLKEEHTLQTSIDKLHEEIMKISGQFRMSGLRPPTPPKTQVAGVACEHCQQMVSEDHAKSLIEKYNQELMEFNRLQREEMDHNAPLEARKAELSTQHSKLSESLGTVRKQVLENSTKIKLCKESLVELEKQLDTLRKSPATKPTAPTKPDGDEAALRKELTTAQGVLHTAKTFKQQLETLGAQAELYRESIQVLGANIDRYAQIEEAIKKLPLIETQKTLEKLQIKGIQLSLYEGELLVRDSGGVDYRSLSDGRRMKIDVQICLSIQAAAGPTAPKLLFIDNADLMDAHVDFVVPEGVQVIKAHVDSTVEDVEVRYA